MTFLRFNVLKYYFANMLRTLFSIIAFILISLSFYGQSLGQSQSIVQEGEFGIGAGFGHYFGDLNTRAHLNRPKIAATAFFRKNFGNYIAVRAGVSFAQLGYSDIYNDYNSFMLQRNLSFNSNIWELALQGDFNFFRFMPGERGYNFTPYITFGVGIFNYDPFALLAGQKHYLRPLNTEGQGNSLYPERNPYGSMAVSFPIGAGVKYSINERINVGFELVHRITNTDYLDDISTTYADPSVFPPLPDGSPSTAFLLQDRSYELGEPIGKPGLQRGNSKQKDQFITGIFYISFNLQSYRCPTVN
jgi:Domain of unknown function (DUF6089)